MPCFKVLKAKPLLYILATHLDCYSTLCILGYHEALENAIDNSHCVLFVISPDFLKNDHCLSVYEGVQHEKCQHIYVQYVPISEEIETQFYARMRKYHNDDHYGKTKGSIRLKTKSSITVPVFLKILSFRKHLKTRHSPSISLSLIPFPQCN